MRQPRSLVFDELISHLEVPRLVSSVTYFLSSPTIVMSSAPAKYCPVRLSVHLTGPLFYILH